MSDSESDPPLSQASLIAGVIDRVESIIKAAEKSGLPLDMDPVRSDLFETFVVAEGAGLLIDMEPNLLAETIAEKLSERWNLREISQGAFKISANSNDPAVRRVQLLWSVCRQWMAWTYAWGRWAEFH